MSGEFLQPHLCADCLERAARAVAQSGSAGLIYLEYCPHVAGGTLARIVAFDGGVSQMVLSAPTSAQEAAKVRAGIETECGRPIMRDGEVLN